MRKPSGSNKSCILILIIGAIIVASVGLVVSSCSTPETQPAKSGPVSGLAISESSRAVTDQDLRILLRADELLPDESAWNRSDDRVCNDDESTGKRSLFCALHKACVEVVGVYDHRRVALQEVRFVVEEATRGRELEHRLRDYNNLAETRFSDIKSILAAAIKRVRERLNGSAK